MDNIKKKIEEIVKKVKEDKDIAKKFKSNPIKTVEDLLGVDLPDDQINKIVEGVQAKITLDNAGDLLSKAKGLLK
jgi:uncharacterized protein YpuA (DUF1002 family)